MKPNLEKIALKFLRVPTLELRGSDSLDFHDCGVANIKQALENAYLLGTKDNKLLLDNLLNAINGLHKAKDRYQSQIACARLFELAGLSSQYPTNYKNRD